MSYIFTAGDIVEMVDPNLAHVNGGLEKGAQAVITCVESPRYVRLKPLLLPGSSVGCITFRIKPVPPVQGELF